MCDATKPCVENGETIRIHINWIRSISLTEGMRVDKGAYLMDEITVIDQYERTRAFVVTGLQIGSTLLFQPGKSHRFLYGGGHRCPAEILCTPDSGFFLYLSFAEESGWTPSKGLHLHAAG